MFLVSDLPADVLGQIFSQLPIASMKSVLCTCRKWNEIANRDIVWINIAQSLPLPGKISDRHIQYLPEWQIYNEAAKVKEKVKQFLLTSRSAFIYVTNEELEYNLESPFLYRRGKRGAAGYYPDYLGPNTFNFRTSLLIKTENDAVERARKYKMDSIICGYPFGPRNHPILPLCVHDTQGQPINHFPNSSQYFYLLNKKEGDQLYWTFNGVFYRITCLQQSPHSNMPEHPFEQVISERVKKFIESGVLSQEHIDAKQNQVKELYDLAQAENFDTRWLMII